MVCRYTGQVRPAQRNNIMDLVFPIKGQHKGFITEEQPGVTTFELLNARPYDTLANRLRGGKRPGLDKWGAGVQIGAAEQPVVAMCIVSAVV